MVEILTKAQKKAGVTAKREDLNIPRGTLRRRIGGPEEVYFTKGTYCAMYLNCTTVDAYYIPNDAENPRIYLFQVTLIIFEHLFNWANKIK